MRGPGYGGYGRRSSSGLCGKVCSATALAVVMFLIAAALGVNYLYIERSKCANKIDELEDVSSVSILELPTTATLFL